ncbi:MAG: SpoIID/LytB domain-containing protein [Chloroflexi bacterium]|nr:SpoIID/LytB domain-containing protein [Chloroflexota bacterium]
MRLFDYPRPPGDTGIGFHYFPDMGHYRHEDFSRWMPILKSLGVSWLTLLAPLDQPIAETFVKGLQDGGVEPLIRIYSPGITPLDQTALGQLAQTYARWGAHYLTVYDQPNLAESWTGFKMEALPDRFMGLLLPCLNTLAAVEGIIPVFTPLACPGNYWDTEFLRTCLDLIVLRGRKALFERLAVGMHNFAANRPLGWGRGGPSQWPQAKPYHTPPGSEDQTGFRLFEWYDALIRARVGRSLPLLACANGSRYDSNEAHEFPRVDETLHAARHGEMTRALMNRGAPDYVFNNAFWLLSADDESPYTGDRWFYPDGSARLAQSVAALKALPHTARAIDLTLELPATIRVLMDDNATVREIDFEDYLKGVVPSEIGPEAPIEAQKAQAVAARCYAALAKRHRERGADICTTTHCQVWRERRWPQSDEAVESTRGIAVTDQGAIIRAYYFARCDGQATRDSEHALHSLDGYRTCEERGWGVVPTCRAVPCTGHAPHTGDCGFYGHGVGLCQTGASDLARRGLGFVDILTHYYTGALVMSLSRPPTTPPAASRPEPVEGPPEPQPETPPAPRPAPVKEPPATPAPTPPPDAPVVSHWQMEARRSAGPRAIAGAFPRAEMSITIGDASGHSVTLASGSKPQYGSGGFELPVWSDGLYTVQFDGESFQVEVANNFVFLTFHAAGGPSTGSGHDAREYQIVSALMDAPRAQEWLDHLTADASLTGQLALETLGAGAPGGPAWGVYIERKAGVRALAGSLPRPGITVRVTSAAGQAVEVVSGSKPEHGAGGFEVLCWQDGNFTVAFLDQHFVVPVNGSFTRADFVELKNGGTRLASGLLTRDEAERRLADLQAVEMVRDLFGIEKKE